MVINFQLGYKPWVVNWYPLDLGDDVGHYGSMYNDYLCSIVLVHDVGILLILESLSLTSRDKR